MISSPTGYSSLQYDNVTGGDGTASLVGGRGRATFSGLFIDEAGEGFVCRFVAFNAAGLGVAWVDSNPFDVGIGEPYKIALSTPVGTMKGGERIEKAPVVAVQASRAPLSSTAKILIAVFRKRCTPYDECRYPP